MISVCIATYNGAEYLKEQIDSILCQLNKNDEVVVSDDHSTDNTIEILSEYNDSRIKIFSNNNNYKGVIGNFENAIKHSTGDYIFLADQDDVWLPFKIDITLSKIQNIENNNKPNTPILVFTDVIVVDEELKILINSINKQNEKNSSFSGDPNILCVANRMMGCTMAFNKKTKEICLPISQNAVMHDWWIALCVSKYGIIESIQESTILYRQHANNVVGCRVIQKNGLINRIKRLRALWKFNKKIYIMSSSFFPMSFFKYWFLKFRLHV